MFSSSQGDLYDVMEKKGKLDAGTCIRYALDIARFAIFQSSNFMASIVRLLSNVSV